VALESSLLTLQTRERSCLQKFLHSTKRFI
jgi:hypothetical protein